MITQFILFLMAIEDIRTMKVSDLYQIILLMWILVSEQIPYVLIGISLLIYAVYLLIRNKIELKIGGADIKLFCILLLLGVETLVIIAFWASLFGLLYSIITRKTKIPFVPFIWLGYSLVYI